MRRVLRWACLVLMSGGCEHSLPRDSLDAAVASDGARQADADTTVAFDPATSLLRAIGDSITFGYLVPSARYAPAERWPDLLGARLGFSPINVDNRGINAATAATMWTDEILPLRFTADLLPTVHVVFAGTNDARIHGDDAVGLVGFRHAMRANIAFLLARGSMVPADDPSITYSGSWTATDQLMNRSSQTPGDTVSFIATGRDIWIGSYGLCSDNANNAASLEIKIDGTVARIVSTDDVCRSAGPSSGLAFAGQFFTPMVFRFGGLLPVSHSVTVTNLGGGYGYFSWYAVPDRDADQHIFVGNLLHNTPAGYSYYAPYYNQSSDVAVSLHDQAIAEVVAEFASEGYRVWPVDLTANFVGNLTGVGTDPLMQSDEVHPNQLGLSVIAGTFAQKMATVLELN